MKKILSFLLVLTMFLSLVPTAFAQSNVSGTTENSNSESEIVQDGGLGSLIANSLAEQEEEDDTNIENKILDVTMDGNVATVSFNNNVDAKIIVAIYDEKTNLMKGSGIETFEPHSETGEVTIDIDTMPEHYVIRAFLLDINNRPLHSSFESNYYTTEHQEFLATTINDFEDETILSFDGSVDNNFAVFNENTIIIDETATTNILISSDIDNATYVFTNADKTLSGLKVGDVFYYTATNDECIAGKVASNTTDGTYTTIVSEQDVALDEVFSFAKIDTTGNGEGAEVDTADADEGVTYEGEYSSSTYASVNVSSGITQVYSIDHEFKDKNANDDKQGTATVKFVGSMGISITFDLEVKLSGKNFFVDFHMKEQLTYEGSVTGKISSKQYTLSTVHIPTGIAGLRLETKIKFVVSVSASITFSATQESTVGFKIDSKGCHNTSKPSTIDTDIKLSGKFYVGLILDPKVKVFNKLIELGVEGEAGVEVVVETRNRTDTDTQKHLCSTCAQGSVNLVFNFKVTFKLKLLFIKSSSEFPVWDAKLKVHEFYISDTLGFGKGVCPNDSYKITIQVVDSNSNALSGAAVGSLTTNSKGQVQNFYKAGKHTVSVSKSGYTTKSQSFTATGPSTITITLNSSGQSSGGSVSTVVDSGVLTANKNISWKLYSNGTLTISGKGAITFPSTNANSSPWYNRQDIKKVVINNGITSIGRFAFWYCRSLTSITIPSSVTTINEYAFSRCHSLTSVTIPNSVTSIGDGAFKFCYSLTSITLPKSITSISYETFMYCNKLAKVTILGNITSVGDRAFCACSNLTSISIPVSVTYFGENAFDDCYKLTDVYYAGTATQWGKINGIAGSCLPLMGTIVHYNSTGPAASVSTLSLRDKTAVASVGANTENLAAVTEATPDYCYTTQAQELVPNTPYVLMVLKGDETSYSVDTDSLLYITDSTADEAGNIEFTYYTDSEEDFVALMFGACNHDVGDWTVINEPTQTETGLKAQFCNKCGEAINNEVIPATFPEGLEYSIADGKVTITKYTGTATALEIPATIEGYPVVEIGNDSLRYCRDLEYVSIPEGVTRIGGRAFEQCNSLETIVIPSTVTSISNYAFTGCMALKDVELPEGLTFLGDGVFAECYALESITIPDGITVLNKDLFRNCTSLKSVTFSKNIKTIITGAFNGCTALKDVYYSGNKSEWQKAKIEDNNAPLASATINYGEELPASGKITVFVSGGTGFTVSVNNSSARPQGTYFSNSSIAIGSQITLTAYTMGSNDFIAWVNPSDGKILSSSLAYTFYSSGNDNFIAMFKSDIEGFNMVTFYNDKAKQQVDVQYYSATDSITFPYTDPVAAGWIFKGWNMSEAEIQAELAAGNDVTVTPVWEKELVYVNLNITGGTASGATNATGQYLANNAVTVTADAAPAGKKFAYWTDGTGTIKSYETTYKFYPAADITLTAVFVDEGTAIEYKVLASVDTFIANTYGQFNTSWYVPTEQNGYTFIGAGLIAVNSTKYNESTFVHGTSDSNVYDKTSSSTAPSGTYIWTGPVYSGETWYCKAWVQYKDASGNIQTVYSDLFTAVKE